MTMSIEHMRKLFEIVNHSVGWSGFGEPVWLKRVTVVTALSVALLCVVYAFRLRHRTVAHRWSLQLFYSSQALLLFVVAINKQLDALNWLTAFSRFWAMREGWYTARGPVQVALIVGIGGASLLLLGLACWGFRRILRHHWLPLVGAIGLLTYVAIRAVSLHAVDAMLADRVLGVRWDWIFELGGVFFLFCSLSLTFYWQQRASAARRHGESRPRHDHAWRLD